MDHFLSSMYKNSALCSITSHSSFPFSESLIVSFHDFFSEVPIFYYNYKI